MTQTEHSVMDILVFKTDIHSTQQVRALGVILNHYRKILEWAIDTDDVDNVLRIVPNDKLAETDIEQLVRAIGFQCEALPD